MQFYKKSAETNNNNEYLKMTSEIKRDLINNVCFECGAENPQYISINNAIFICKDCIVNHLSFSHNISQIIINDLCSLNLTEIKTLFYGGNRKLIQFINFDFPGLRQLPPEVLYKTLAVDYYRKNLKFLVNGGKKPLRPGAKFAYKLVEYRDSFLSPRNGKNEKYFNSTELTPILEGKDELDEIENNEDNDTFLEINKNFSDNTKNDSTMGNTPQKNKSENINDVNNNNSNSFFEKNANNISNIVNKYTKKNVRNKYKNKNKINNNEKEEIKDNSKNGDEIKLNIDKNISEIINNEENNNITNSNIKSSETNNNNLNDDVSGEDNTLKIVNGYINISRENEFSDFKSNKENNDYSNSFTKGKLEENNKDENKIKNQKMGRNNYNDKAFIKNDKKMKTEINIEKKYKKNKKEKNISDDENKDKEDINDDYFIIVDKKNDKEIKTSKKENKLHKNKIIKKNEYSEEEDEEEEEDDDEIKSEKLIYPINSKKVKNEKLNLTEIKPNRHLKVKISSSRIFNFNDDKDDNFNEKIKTKKIANKKEKRNRYVMTSKEIITKKSKKDKDDFFSKKSSFGSGFINPLKYLQKSFQKKQNEKFEDSDTNEEEEEDSFEEEEISNKNKKYIKNGKIRKYKFEKEEK